MKVRNYLMVVFACLAVAAGWVTGCGSNSSPTGPTVAVGVPPTVTALTVRGNTALTAPGQTTQLTAEATMSDGSSKEVTSNVQWSSSDRNVVMVSPSGLATAVDFGRANVGANTAGRSSPLVSIAVLPEGTYILAGRVSEAGNLSVLGARVEIVGGPMSGLARVTTSSGSYAFNGVSGAAQVRVTKDGYQTATQTISEDTEHVNVGLTPSVPYASIGGVYSLTFNASPSCNLPDDAVKRTYTATIDQRGAPMTIFLSDARFVTAGRLTFNQFSGRALGNVVSFTLDTYYCLYYGGCVVEQIGDNRYLTLTGTAQAIVTTPANISAVFAGAVTVTGQQNGDKPIAACTAADHHLVFERSAAPARKR